MRIHGATSRAIVGLWFVLGFAPARAQAQLDSIAHQFDMFTVQHIALLDASTGGCLSGGMGSVQQPWDTDPLVLMPTTGATLAVRLVETEIALNPGFPIVNVLLYAAPRDAGDYCIGLLDTTTKIGATLYTGELQQPGSTYLFRDPQTGAPIVLQAGQSYFLYAHVAAQAASGPANVIFTLSPVGAAAPALSTWLSLALVGLLLAGGTLALKGRPRRAA